MSMMSSSPFGFAETPNKTPQANEGDNMMQNTNRISGVSQYFYSVGWIFNAQNVNGRE